MAKYYGKHLSEVTIGGFTITGCVKTADLNHEPVSDDFTCLPDASPANQKVRESFNHSITAAYDSAFATELAGIIALVGTTGNAFTITSVSAGFGYTGSAYISSHRHGIPDGGQEITFDLIPDGS